MMSDEEFIRKTKAALDQGLKDLWVKMIKDHEEAVEYQCKILAGEVEAPKICGLKEWLMTDTELELLAREHSPLGVAQRAFKAGVQEMKDHYNKQWHVDWKNECDHLKDKLDVALKALEDLAATKGFSEIMRIHAAEAIKTIKGQEG